MKYALPTHNTETRSNEHIDRERKKKISIINKRVNKNRKKISTWYRLDIGLMKGHEAGMDRDGDCGKMKVIEEHRQMIVKSLRGREVQLQRPTKRKANENLRQIFRMEHERPRLSIYC